MNTVPDKIKTVLSVEDDEFMIFFLKDIFWVHGGGNYDFKNVNTFKKAREILAKEDFKPDLLLVDLMFPADDNGKPELKNGLDLIKEIKENPKTKNAVLVVFSGYSDAEIREKVLELGADRFMLKGEYLPKEFIEVIKQIISRRKEKKVYN
ncbi:response regulator [Candidatus Giovannonibacteria bacterium]|nr:response regulator [Candidatus Giovannonibacteria bacterium]